MEKAEKKRRFRVRFEASGKQEAIYSSFRDAKSISGVEIRHHVASEYPELVLTVKKKLSGRNVDEKK